MGEGLKKGFPLKRGGGGGASAYIGNLENIYIFFTSWKRFLSLNRHDWFFIPLESIC